MALKQSAHSPNDDPADRSLDDTPENIRSRLDAIALRLDLQASLKGEKPKQPWWIIVAQILAIPGVLIAMFLQFGQTRESEAGRQKTIAETAKIQTEELKTRLEIQDRLEELKKKTESASLTQQREALQQSLPQLQEAITRLDTLAAARRVATVDFLLPAFIFVWAAFLLTGLGLDIFRQLFNTAVGSIFGLVFSPLDRRRRRRPVDEQKRNRRIRAVQIAAPTINLLPSIIEWAIRITLISMLVIPLLFAAARYTGSEPTLNEAIGAARKFDLPSALRNFAKLTRP